MKILGLNAVFHDSAACLLVDGVAIAAAEEERFVRIKHHKRTKPFNSYALPFHAIDYCLREAGLKLGDLDHIAYSFDPFPLINRPGRAEDLPLPGNAEAARRPLGFDPWQSLFLAGAATAPHVIGDYVPWELQRSFGAGAGGQRWQFHFVPHHVAHAASAYFPSPFDEAAVMTLDGFGGDATTAYGHGRGAELSMIGSVQLPHSLGLLYEQMTGFLGFKPSSDEYKVMALAALGKPEQAEALRRLVQVGEGGRYTVQPLALAERFGPPREPGSLLDQRHLDLACSLQTVLEETVLELAGWLHGATGADALCLAGGVALNCVLNARLRDDGPFRDVWVQPAAGDAGTALGAALWVDSQQGEPGRRYRMESALLGPSFTDEQIGELLRESKLRHRLLTDVGGETAELLVQDRILGWFQGRMEFGPRALGARSILASPLNEATRDRLNDIKGREEFRPVAPAVLAHRAADWFEPATESPFMLFTHRIRPDRIDRIPAARHDDGTARIQTVDRDRNPAFFDLIAAFEERTGVPIVVNTSFNTAGRPIVCTPRDAIECFFASPLDALVIGSFLLEK